MMNLYEVPQADATRALREDLRLAYRIFAHLGWDDLTYTHISARIPGADTYFIQPFGMLFEEVEPESLIELSMDGKTLHDVHSDFNHTGYVIHGSIYSQRPDINAIVHLHTIDGVAVSAMQDGLMPISQFALHFYDKLSYHDYGSLALQFHGQGDQLAADLGANKAMLLSNHGTLTCGGNLAEAVLYAHFLEKACQVQVRALSGGRGVVTPPAAICKKAAEDLRNFETDFGARDWKAWKRKLG